MGSRATQARRGSYHRQSQRLWLQPQHFHIAVGRWVTIVTSSSHLQMSRQRNLLNMLVTQRRRNGRRSGYLYNFYAWFHIDYIECAHYFVNIGYVRAISSYTFIYVQKLNFPNLWQGLHQSISQTYKYSRNIVQSMFNIWNVHAFFLKEEFEC